MDCITHSLKSEQDSSDFYYGKIIEVSNKIKEKILFGGNDYLNDFMQFIVSDNIEELRSKEEYGIELLLIGVLFKEYIDNVRNFKSVMKGVFIKLNQLKEKNKYSKMKINNIRGKLVTMLLMKKKHSYKEICMDDFLLLINWMEASGEFNEEVIRLKQWEQFLNEKGKYYSRDMFIYCDILVSQFNEICKESLDLYIKQVKQYLETYKNINLSKVEESYCGKGDIQYFFNMISTEIINKTYRSVFLDSDEKIVFLPYSMNQADIDDCSMKILNCEGDNDCDENDLLHREGQDGFKTFIVPPGIEWNNLHYEGKNIGIISISCTMNLFSEELKLIRLGFKPQCMLLDYCDCDK